MSHASDLGKRILHASSIETECGWRDHQYATDAWHRPPWRPFLRGTAVHGARQHALSSYMAGDGLPSVKECQQIAASVAEDDAAEREQRGDHVDRDELTAAIDEALPIVEADVRLLLPQTAPMVHAVEETLDVDLGGGWSLVGTLDTRGKDPMTGTGLICDLKTSGKSPGSGAITHSALSLQLSAYALLHEVHFGSIPLIALQYAWTMARGPKAETIGRDGLKVCDLETGKGVGVARVIATQRSAADLDAARKRLRLRIDAEESGWHTPAYSGFMSPCHRCAHWGHEDAAMRCEFVTQIRPSTLGRVKEDDE